VPGPFPDLSSFVRFLEEKGQLRRIKAEVDPALEVTEIALRTVKSRGPALLFENVKGSSFPLLLNPLAAEERIEWALGRPPARAGEDLKAFIEDMRPPKLSSLWRHRKVLGRALAMRTKRAGRAPVLDVTEAPDLDRLPILTCWPEDGGRFITLPLVMTHSPANGVRNTGIYRMHVHDKASTGMHWQIHKGGGFHYHEAEARGQALPLAVTLGADPISILTGVLPLPEDVDELAFAGFLRGSPTRVTRLSNGVEVPADAEIILEGEVPPRERKTEGPFGDHFGHYSHAAPFPVFHVKKVHHRRNAIYPAAVVGKPPQEDKYLGDAVQEMLLPLLKVMHPEITDLWAYYEAGFHNLAVASVKQRYRKEAVRSALWLFGEGQMSLTKCIVLVDPGVNVRRFEDVLDAVRKKFDPREDLILLPGTAQDTLDFTSFTMNLGSKMILDATSLGKDRSALPRPASVGFTPGMTWRSWRDAMLVVQVKDDVKPTLERLVRDPSVAGYRLVVAVSPDVPLDDPELLLWGIFTRFDCARDLVPAKASFTAGGAWPVFEGPIGIDASWKKGYPKALEMDPAVVAKVDRRWKEYGI
jgi:4-hydroxy-3-polyprenylbenzoate decarboxylase